MIERNIYSKEGIDMMIDDDMISNDEYSFMLGYIDA